MIGMTLEEALIQGAAMRGGGSPAPTTTVKAWFEGLQLCDTLQLSTVDAGFSDYSIQVRVGAAYGGKMVASQRYATTTWNGSRYGYKYDVKRPSKHIFFGVYRDTKLLYVKAAGASVWYYGPVWNVTTNSTGVYGYRSRDYDWRYDSDRQLAHSLTVLDSGGYGLSLAGAIYVPYIRTTIEYQYIFHNDAPPTPNGSTTTDSQETFSGQTGISLPNVYGDSFVNYCYSDLSESELTDENEEIIKICAQVLYGQTPTIIDPIN